MAYYCEFKKVDILDGPAVDVGTVLVLAYRDYFVVNTLFGEATYSVTDKYELYNKEYHYTGSYAIFDYFSSEI